MDKRRENVKGYLVYIAITIGFIYIGSYILENIFNHYENQYPFQLQLFLIKDALFSVYLILLGAILGLQHIYNEKRKAGKWRLNSKKLFILGLPMFILSLMIHIYYVGYARVFKIFDIFYRSQYLNVYTTIFKLILGYIIVTSFYKSSQEEQG